MGYQGRSPWLVSRSSSPHPSGYSEVVRVATSCPFLTFPAPTTNLARRASRERVISAETDEGARDAVQMLGAGRGNPGTLSGSCPRARQMVHHRHPLPFAYAQG